MSSPSALLDISALSQEAGVTSRTIRYYGEKGLLKADHRGAGGRRMFGPDALERLLFIGRLKNLGLTLEEIGTLNQSFDRGKTAAMLGDLESLLHDRRLEVAARIKELQHLDQELAAYQKRIRTKRNS